jgi:hypothetical protein
MAEFFVSDCELMQDAFLNKGEVVLRVGILGKHNAQKKGFYLF